MSLLERVSRLLRANVNDLLARTEDPAKLARQLVLDMENQLVQVKTQVAIAVADQHLLQQKRAEQEELHMQWLRKAELAVNKQQDDLARLAIERSLSHQRLAEGLAEQHADQVSEADNLRAAYQRLQQKLTETQVRVELLTVQHRRNRTMEKARVGQAITDSQASQSEISRLTASVREEAHKHRAARTVLAINSAESLDERFANMEQNDQIEALLEDLKKRQPRLA